MTDKSCPECGAPWRVVRTIGESMSDWGYLHTDEHVECSRCHHTWSHGHPGGQYRNDDLICPVCEDVLQAHKLDPRKDLPEAVHLKCPTCHYFTTGDQVLELMDNGEWLFGYPEITGDLLAEAGDEVES